MKPVAREALGKLVCLAEGLCGVLVVPHREQHRPA